MPNVPTLDLYIGKKINGITHGDEAWEWGIRLEGGVEFRNKDTKETFAPLTPEHVLNGYRFMHISLSTRDTTLHFMGPGATKITVSFAPTKYVICDPSYGAEVYPQWPEELDARGITANEGTALPNPEPTDSDAWEKAQMGLFDERERRHEQEATEFLKEGDDDGNS